MAGVAVASQGFYPEWKVLVPKRGRCRCERPDTYDALHQTGASRLLGLPLTPAIHCNL